MLPKRNIFDPDRNKDYVPYTPGATRPTPTPYVRSSGPTPTPKPVEYVQLTGVMTTEEETYAFFAGTQPEFNKVVPVNGSIAGATITTITPSGIVVTRNGKQIGVPVGMTVPMDDTQQPGPPPTTGTSSSSYAPSSANTTSTISAPAAGSPVPAASGATPPVDPQSLSQQVPLETTPAPSGTSGTSSAQPDNVSDAMRRMMERRQKELNNQ